MKNKPFIHDLPATGYVRQSQLIPGILPFSPATLWRLVRAGKFPAPVRLADRITAWDVQDVRNWIVSQKLDSDRPATSPPRSSG
jgi:prophage regulatory protein